MAQALKGPGKRASSASGHKAEVLPGVLSEVLFVGKPARLAAFPRKSAEKAHGWRKSERGPAGTPMAKKKVAKAPAKAPMAKKKVAKAPAKATGQIACGYARCKGDHLGKGPAGTPMAKKKAAKAPAKAMGQIAWPVPAWQRRRRVVPL